MKETESERNRRRWITFGELIALGALIVSALGLWINWKSNQTDGPAKIVEQRQPIPLRLRATREDDGKRLSISPVEQGHALQSLTIALPGASPIRVGSDGELYAGDVKSVLTGGDEEPKNRTRSVQVRVEANYVEMGKDRRSSGTYTLRYMWKGAGLLGGRSVHLVGLSRG